VPHFRPHPADGEECHRRTQGQDERHHSEAAHGPVDRDTRSCIHGANGADRREHRQRRAQRTRQHGPYGHGSDHAERPRKSRCGRARAQRAQRLELECLGTQLSPDELCRDDDRCEQSDQPEYRERDRLGLDRTLSLGLGCRTHPQIERRAGGQWRSPPRRPRRSPPGSVR
jgi:hypothetical protein